MGAPAMARTALMPMVRSNVLFPDMFEPLTSITRVSRSSRTLFRTHLESGISGCPRFSPMKVIDDSSANSGKGSPGCSNERSEEHTSELQSLTNLVCRLLLEKKNNNRQTIKNLDLH